VSTITHAELEAAAEREIKERYARLGVTKKPRPARIGSGLSEENQRRVQGWLKAMDV